MKERENARSASSLMLAQKKSGYDSQATRRALFDSVTALRPEIRPYDWQIDVAESLALVLDATVFSGT